MIDVFKTVFWGFFGVRRRADHDAAEVRLSPGKVIAAGLACATVLVLAIFGAVRLITQ